jgi:hypothetical protein
MTGWTIEELSLVDIYNRGSRLSTQSALEQLLPYLWDEPEMAQVAENAISKLDGISDMDYLLMMLDYEPADDEWEWEESYE